jgi:beta-lactamase class A
MPTVRRASLAAALAALEARFGGDLSVAASDLSGGDPLHYRAERPIRAASTIKVPLLIAWLEGVADGEFDRQGEIELPDGVAVPGTGVLKLLTPGRRYPAIDLATLMICVSDNTATNALLSVVGIARVNALAERHGWHHTRLHGPLQAQPPATPPTTCAADLHTMMADLWGGRLLPARETAVAKHILLRQQYTEHLGRYIGYDYYDAETARSPISIASKSGNVRGVRNEVGVIRRGEAGFVLAITSETSADTRFHIDNPGHEAVARITELLFDHYLTTSG